MLNVNRRNTEILNLKVLKYYMQSLNSEGTFLFYRRIDYDGCDVEKENHKISSYVIYPELSY